MRTDRPSLRFPKAAVRSSSSVSRWRWLAITASFAATLSSAVNAGTLTAIRSGDHGDYQRLVFDLRSTARSSGDATAAKAKLERIDALNYELTLPDTEWQVNAQRLGNADLIHSLRQLPPTQPNQLRLQLRLTAAAAVQTRTLPAPARLLLDLRAGYEAPAANNKKTAANSEKPAANNKKPTPAKLASKPTQKTITKTPAQVAEQPKPKNLRIIIDPGHGGKAPGAVGPTGVLEKDVVLAICKQLHTQLNQRPGITALLTRDRDLDLSLQERVNIARERQADLFVSVHADAIRERSVRGGSVYVLSNVGANKAARRWAGTLNRIPEERRNLAGIDLNNRDATVANVLFDLVQTDTIQRSNQLASDVLSHLSADNQVRFKNVKLAELGVLKAPDIPSILVETAFISNPSDERLLNSKQGQKRLAKSIAEGLERFARRSTEIARARSRLNQNHYQDYAVTKGDTLFSLARRFSSSVKAIRKANALPNSNLRPGMVLRIPTVVQRVASRN